MRFFSKSSDGGLVIACCHPRSSLTWHWSISLSNRRLVRWQGRFWLRAGRRKRQWHDYYRLPFGRTLIWSAQDYHKDTPHDR